LEPAAPARGRRALPARLWLLVSAVVVIGVVNQVYGINIALYVTRDLHRGAQLVGWMAGACAGLEIPVMIAAGRLAGRVGRTRLVIAATMGAAVFFCLLPLAHSAAALLGLQVLNAAWVGIALSLPMVMIQDEAPGGAGQSSSLYTSALVTAQLLAGAIAGVTASAIGFGNAFWVCAALCAVATALLAARELSPGGRQGGKAARLA
jgi:SET family sugar efflux transporter-like MFS transporter